MKVKARKNVVKKTIVTHIEEVSTFENRNGGKMVEVLDVNGTKYTNFESVWNRQDINIEALSPNDTVEITYHDSLWNGKTYKNFDEIRVLESQPGPSADEVISDDEAAAIFEAM